MRYGGGKTSSGLFPHKSNRTDCVASYQILIALYRWLIAFLLPLPLSKCLHSLAALPFASFVRANSFGVQTAKMPAEEPIADKIGEIQAEMQRIGLWNPHQPAWVNHYSLDEGLTEAKFSEWLQFIYLPNLLRQAHGHQSVALKENVTPQAVKFFSDEVKQGKMLQLLVELDSLL